MIGIPEAQDTVLEHTPVLASEQVPLQEALGRVLADTVTATDDLPPFPASIKVRCRHGRWSGGLWTTCHLHGA